MSLDIREIGPRETLTAWPALSELRPHVGSAERFLEHVERQRAEGYRLVGVFDEDDGTAAAVAGFRVAHSLAWGRHLYVDDLVTMAAHRKQGHAWRLMNWLLAEARRLDCDALHLDSGHARHDAHRLYLTAGLRISSHHFSVELRGGDSSASRDTIEPVPEEGV